MSDDAFLTRLITVLGANAIGVSLRLNVGASVLFEYSLGIESHVGLTDMCECNEPPIQTKNKITKAGMPTIKNFELASSSSS